MTLERAGVNVGETNGNPLVPPRGGGEYSKTGIFG